MSERTTKAEVNAVFARFVKAIGGRVAESYNDIGGYGIDYNPTYGGYHVYRVDNAAGGQNLPFGSRRMKPGEFVDCLRFATEVVQYKDSGRMLTGAIGFRPTFVDPRTRR